MWSQIIVIVVVNFQFVTLYCNKLEVYYWLIKNQKFKSSSLEIDGSYTVGSVSKCASTSFSLRVDDLAMLDYAAQEMGLTYSETIRRLIRVKYLQLTTNSSENTE